jgi:anion-transporting  ArsA/GET3 family ATPase
MDKYNVDEKEFSVNDLINELNINTKENKALLKNEEFNLPKDKLEEFVLNSTGRLVTQGLEIVEGVKEYVMNNPESREVLALSDALKAVASALSVVKDIHVSQIKRDSAKDLKTMEIEARKNIKQEDTRVGLFITRDELFKKIMEDAKVIEAEASVITKPRELSESSPNL